MFANERQNKIFKLIEKQEAVTTSSLIDKFQVSAETVRRDLLRMEKKGMLNRVHGGAVAIGEMKENHLSSLRSNKKRKKEYMECI